MSLHLGEFEQIVLMAMMQLGDDAYGVTIAREIERRTGRGVSMGGLYTTLDRMARKGLARASHGNPTPTRGGRAKKFWTPTREGARALERSLSALRRMAEGLDDKVQAP